MVEPPPSGDDEMSELMLADPSLVLVDGYSAYVALASRLEDSDDEAVLALCIDVAGRENHTQQPRTVSLMMSAQDAVVFFNSLRLTLRELAVQAEARGEFLG